MNFRSAPEYYPEAAGDRTTTSASRAEVAHSLTHCPNRSPNAAPRKEQSAQKEHTVAWDLNGAQSAHPMILPVDVSTEAESPSVQFNPMNMPKIKKVPPVIHYQPDTALFNTLRKSPKKNPRGKEKNRKKEDSLPRGNWFVSARARSIGFGSLGVLPKESASQALSD
jgi:hypothetical protein